MGCFGRRRDVGARLAAAALCLLLVLGARAGYGQSLEEESLAPPGTNSLDDGSLHGGNGPHPDWPIERPQPDDEQVDSSDDGGDAGEE